MSAHTPGPWKVGSEQLRGGLYWYVAIPGAEETIDLHESENGEANARLIAAAPDLFAAILKSDDAHWTPAMRAAIKKATTP